MSKLRVELNRAGVRELMRSPEMRAIVETRAVAMVFPATAEAEADNLKNNTLLKALR